MLQDRIKRSDGHELAERKTRACLIAKSQVWRIKAWKKANASVGWTHGDLHYQKSAFIQENGIYIRFPSRQFQITGYIYNGWRFLIIESNNLIFFISSLALIDHSNNALANSFVAFSEKETTFCYYSRKAYSSLMIYYQWISCRFLFCRVSAT